VLSPGSIPGVYWIDQGWLDKSGIVKKWDAYFRQEVEKEKIMSETYVFNDMSNIDIKKLHIEIAVSPIITAIERIDFNYKTLKIVFPNPLSRADEAILRNIVNKTLKKKYLSPFTNRWV